MFIRFPLIALLSLVFGMQAFENPTELSPEVYTEFTSHRKFGLPNSEEATGSEKKDKTKVAFYLSGATLWSNTAPGVGVSFREPKKYSADVDLHSIIDVNWLCATGSMIFPTYHFGPNTYTYFSIGGGAMGAYIKTFRQKEIGAAGPVIPIRMGREWKSGFVDCGIIPNALFIPGFKVAEADVSLQFRCCLKY